LKDCGWVFDIDVPDVQHCAVYHYRCLLQLQVTCNSYRPIALVELTVVWLAPWTLGISANAQQNIFPVRGHGLAAALRGLLFRIRMLYLLVIFSVCIIRNVLWRWLRGGCSDIGRHQLFGTDAISFLVVYALVCILEVLFDRSKTRTIILA